MKTLIRVAFTALSLTFGIAHAATPGTHPSTPSCILQADS